MIQQTLNQCSNIPLYNTKAVAQETGVPADTFRAWERRYGIPHPHRTDGGHRLYSEKEIAIIRWLRDRTAEGLTISQAIALMHNAPVPAIAPRSLSPDIEPHSLEKLVARLFTAFANFDEKKADQILAEAFALYSLDDVLLRLIQPVLIEVGDQWHQGNVAITVEHLATQFLRRKLFGIFNTSMTYQGRGSIICGCAPSEPHDTGILLFSILLVRSGWQVIYLGTQVPTQDLMTTMMYIQPNMVCLSATLIQSAYELIAIGEAISNIPHPRPHFGYGGQAFLANPNLQEKISGVFLGRDAKRALETINTIFLNGSITTR